MTPRTSAPHRWRTSGGRPILTLLALVVGLLAADGLAAARFTSSYRFDECRWAHRGGQNPYFLPLQPGYRLVLEGEEEEDGEVVEKRVQITVTRQRERIVFTPPGGEPISLAARVVEEREWEDDELVEVSRNWFARCAQTGDVFYFGEDVDIYEDGEIVAHDGAWRAGENGAQPGLIMPATFLLGARYYQEIAPDVAEDRARHVAMDLQVGELTGCVAVLESSRLDAGATSSKVYCPGVGLVLDDVVSLVEYGRIGRRAR